MRISFFLLLFASSVSFAVERVPWTTSKLTGSPDAPPPYRTERVFPKLSFVEPVTFARAPGSDRLFVEELRGKIYSFPDDDACDKADLFLDLGERPGHYRTYGLVFHPDFVRNRQVYVCYVKKAGDPKGSIVSRFKVTSMDPPTADPLSEEILIEWPSGGHNGGALQFGPDGFLYISTGDGSNPSPPDLHNTGQDISDLLSSILRIDVNRKDGDKPYAIPADNPFVKTPNARPEVWAYGLRNPWKLAFDPKTGDLWCGDVGWEMYEMVYRIERGGNYGWSVLEARQPVKPEGNRGPSPILPPTVEHNHIDARSITGGRVYQGTRLKELTGAYIYGDYVTGKFWALRHDGKQVTTLKEIADSPLAIIDFGDGKDGELYILDHAAGTISRLVPNPAAKANANFPKKLSDTGLFASVKEHKPAAGVVPYSINAEPWADHATADRLFAVPGTATLAMHEKSNPASGIVKGEWIFPNDTVLAKTLSLELERGNPASKRRLETQVLHRDGAFWRAYNYVWNDEQTDAILAEADGSDRTFTVKDPRAAGGKSSQTWHHAGRTECLVCHTTRAGSILGFNMGQLNCDRGGANPLQSLASLGYFAGLPAKLPKLCDPLDASASLEQRARSYLHANCAACHRRGGGGTAPFELMHDLPLAKTNLVGTRPTQGTFNIHNAENVAAGNPYRSVLYYRMAKLGSGHMPYAGSNVIDERGLDLIHDWIRGLPSDTQFSHIELERSLPNVDAATIEKYLSSTSNSLYLLRLIDTGKVSASSRSVIVAAARSRPPEIQDLFERFLPEAERVKRLGSVIKPAAILALSGNAARGREVFLKNAGVSCRNCHKVGSEGTEVGPELTLIGKKLDRTKLLESILEPSRSVEPAFVTYTLETVSGAVHSGLLVKKTDKEVVLKDAQAKLITVPAADVDRLVPGQKSLMPELLLRDMTAQDVADMLAFLASLK